MTNMVSQTSLWFIFVFEFKGGGIEGGRGGSKFLKLQFMVKHNSGLVLMTLVFPGENLEIVHETLSIQCLSYTVNSTITCPDHD